MLFFVMSEVPKDQVDQFTQKLANDQVKSVKGNISYVSPDGRFGFDIVEGSDEQDIRQMYGDLEKNGLTIHEVVPILSMGQYIQAWMDHHQQKAA